MHCLKYVLSLQLDMLQQENENVLEQVFSLPFERKNSLCFLIVVDEENMNLCACYSFEKPRENIKKQRPEQENLKDRSVFLFWYNSASCITCFEDEFAFLSVTKTAQNVSEEVSLGGAGTN